MRNFKPLESGSQGVHGDVLFLDADASCKKLIDAADWRLSAVRGLLGVIACSTTDDPDRGALANVARAILLLTDDAAALYAAAHKAHQTRQEG